MFRCLYNFVTNRLVAASVAKLCSRLSSCRSSFCMSKMRPCLGMKDGSVLTACRSMVTYSASMTSRHRLPSVVSTVAPLTDSRLLSSCPRITYSCCNGAIELSSNSTHCASPCRASGCTRMDGDATFLPNMFCIDPLMCCSRRGMSYRRGYFNSYAARDIASLIFLPFVTAPS